MEHSASEARGSALNHSLLGEAVYLNQLLVDRAGLRVKRRWGVTKGSCQL